MIIFASLTECIEILPEPEPYLYGMLKSMVSCKRVHGTVFVRIGITGKGIEPNYLITSNRSDFDGFPDGAPEFIVAYNGRTHEPFNWSGDDLRTQSWSREPSDGPEVVALLQKVKGRSG
jgi:hypothetical protein